MIAMTAQTITSQTEGVFALLEGIEPAYVALLAEVTETPMRGVGYAVLYPGPGRDRARRLGETRGNLEWSGLIVCAGWSPHQCTQVVDAVRAALTGRRLPGSRSNTPLAEREIGDRMKRDLSAPGGPRWSLTLRYNAFASTRS